MKRAASLAMLAVGSSGLLAAPSGAATLKVNQTYTDRAGKVSLLTRSKGRGYITARTRCGRTADYRVTIRKGRISGPRRKGIRVFGRVTSSTSARVTFAKGRCRYAVSLRRSTRPA